MRVSFIYISLASIIKEIKKQNTIKRFEGLDIFKEIQDMSIEEMAYHNQRAK